MARSYKGDSFIVFRSRVFEWDTVSLHIREVFLGFLRCACSQTWLDEGHKRKTPIRYSLILTHKAITMTGLPMRIV